MCLGNLGRVVELVDGSGDQFALVDVEGVTRRVNLGLFDQGAVGPGDWVLIHLGFALEQVDEGTAAQIRADLELMTRGAEDR